MSDRRVGEEQPLIPTADGVREPQNRRVEIGCASAAGDEPRQARSLARARRVGSAQTNRSSP